MTKPRPTEADAEALADAVRHGDAIVEILSSGATPDEMLCRMCEVLDAFEGSTLKQIHMVALFDEQHAINAGAMKDMEASEHVSQQTVDRMRELQGSAAAYTDEIWAVIGLALKAEAFGVNNWGTRNVHRHIDLESGIPMLRVRVSSADESQGIVFDTEESTYAFLRNASGLLYSVKETYRQCDDRNEALPQFLKRKDEWALSEIVSVLMDLCDLRGVRFNTICAEVAADREDDASASPSQ